MKKKIKILIAEDDNLILNALNESLGQAGFEVIVSHNGEEALKLMKKNLPDLLLLDLSMPIKDGFSVLKELRSDPKTKDLHVLVFSNSEDEEDILRARKLGIDDYLLKADYSIREIVETVKGYCQKTNSMKFYYNI